MFIWFFIYIRVLYYAFYLDIPVSVHPSFIENHYLYDFVLIHFFFLIVFSTFIIVPRQEDIRPFRVEDNKFLFVVNYIISCMVFLFGKQGDNIFTSGGYGHGETQVSTINEYFIVFWFAAFFFSGNGCVKRKLLLGLAILYCLKNLMFGGRIETTMIGMGLIYLIYQFRFSLRTFLLLSVIGLYFFTLLGGIRQNPEILIRGEWKQIFIPDWSASERTVDVISSQEGDVIQASSRMTGMVTDNILPFDDRIKSFFYFLASIVLPYSTLPKMAVLSLYKSDIYTVGGGGLVSAYFYVIGSWVGVFFIAFFLAHFLSRMGNRHGENRFVQVYIFFLVATLPRWFAYNPILIFKFSLYGVIMVRFFYCCYLTWRKYMLK
ncbi:hypothetical protein [Bacteroides sp.]|uniref:hypothetical protein n=1 Tax=Bacteroides sp. TaxID=29523 RepID=UPI0025BD7654|nr:hypothetical protein [Bacteroides sp.]